MCLLVFLGYNAHPKSPWYEYPVIKVGDWGLASFTNTLDPHNPERFEGKGTAWYLPPVSKHSKFASSCRRAYGMLIAYLEGRSVL